MAAIPLCEAPLAALKKSLRDEFSDVKSSHLTEALAYSLGHGTYASMQAAMTGPERDRPYVLLDSARFVERLIQLGYEDDPEFDFEMTITGRTDLPGVKTTMPLSAYEIEYTTMRKLAWRNLMVSTINAGLDMKLFTLHSGDNRFDDDMRRGHLFDFELPNGLHVRGSVADAGMNELAVHAAVNPKGDGVRAFDAGFAAGDAFGSTWVERDRGLWMQDTYDSFKCRKGLLAQLAAPEVKPKGYGDRGHITL